MLCVWSRGFTHLGQFHSSCAAIRKVEDSAKALAARQSESCYIHARRILCQTLYLPSPPRCGPLETEQFQFNRKTLPDLHRGNPSHALSLLLSVFIAFSATTHVPDAQNPTPAFIRRLQRAHLKLAQPTPDPPATPRPRFHPHSAPDVFLELGFIYPLY